MGAAPLLARADAHAGPQLWTLSDAVCVATLAGHKAAVSALAFNASGSQLASGSSELAWRPARSPRRANAPLTLRGAEDTEIVVWDPLAESGLFRLQGHKDEGE